MNKSLKAVCKEIAEAVDSSITQRAFDFLAGPETRSYIDYSPDDGGFKWADALYPEIVKSRKTILGAVKAGESGRIEDTLTRFQMVTMDAALMMGIFVGAKLTGASRPQLMELADRWAQRIEADIDYQKASEEYLKSRGETDARN